MSGVGGIGPKQVHEVEPDGADGAPPVLPDRSPPGAATGARTPTSGGPQLDLAGQQLLDRLNASKGDKGSKAVGWLLDGTESLSRTTYEHLWGAHGHVITGAHVEAMVQKAKDYGRITPDEFVELYEFSKISSDRFEPTALKAFQAFLSQNAPPGTYGSSWSSSTNDELKPSKPWWEKPK